MVEPQTVTDSQSAFDGQSFTSIEPLGQVGTAAHCVPVLAHQIVVPQTVRE